MRGPVGKRTIPIEKSDMLLFNHLSEIGELEDTAQFHMPGHNYMGPGTHTISNILSQLEPVDSVDKLSRKHDLDYLKARNNNDLLAADNSMINSLLHRDKPHGFELVDRVPTIEEGLTALMLKLKGLLAPNYGLGDHKLSDAEYEFISNYANHG